MCVNCTKCNPKVIKSEQSKTLKNALPAKDKAPISLTSTARIKSKIAFLKSMKNDLLIENTYLKEQITQLQQEIHTDSLTISSDLHNDLGTIIKNNEGKISPFMQLFSEQQKYLRYHPEIIRYCLSLQSKSPATYE